MATNYERVHALLAHAGELPFERIAEGLGAPSEPVVIAAIARAMAEGLVARRLAPGERRAYKGHTYAAAAPFDEGAVRGDAERAQAALRLGAAGLEGLKAETGLPKKRLAAALWFAHRVLGTVDVRLTAEEEPAVLYSLKRRAGAAEAGGGGAGAAGAGAAGAGAAE